MKPEQIKQWAAEAKIDLEHQVSLSREPVWIATDDELTRFAALAAAWGAQQPLSDEQIKTIAESTKTAEPGRDGYILPYSFARAIESAIAAQKETT